MFHIRALFILIDIRNILYNYIKISLTREELSLFFFWIIYFCIFIIISVLKFRTICINLYFKLHSIYNYSNIKVEKKKRHRFKDATFFFFFFLRVILHLQCVLAQPGNFGLFFMEQLSINSTELFMCRLCLIKRFRIVRFKRFTLQIWKTVHEKECIK